MQPEVKATAQLSAARRALLRRYLRGAAVGNGTKPGAIPRRRGSGPAPLSYSQQQIWLHSQLAGDSLIYNEPITIHRHGKLDLSALVRSFIEIVRRHEAWRTTFEWDDDHPVQIVQPAPSDIEIPLVDLREIPPAEREREAIRLATADVLQPFDLAKGPMYRMRLVRLGDREYRLFLTLHHIIFDGVSLYRVLLPELQSLYEALTKNESPVLAELPIQYPDYAAWQRDSIKEISREHLSYWKHICDDLPVLDLPSDLPRSASQTYAGAMETFQISASTAAALKILSQEQGATPFMTMTAAFMALLHGYTGQEDIAIGGVTSGRHHKETMNLLGCFLNTVVIRCGFSKDLPFTEMLRRVRSATLEALSHDEVPFEMLVQQFATKRDASRAPLVQVLIVVEPPLDPLKEGWAFTHMDVEMGTTKFDLQLGLDDRADGLTGRFIYNTDLFERRTIEVLKSRWLNLLDRIAAAPTQRIRELTAEVWQDVPSDRKRKMPLAEWNHTRTNYPREATIHGVFEEQARKTPSAIAIIFDGVQLSYDELNRRANQLARRLRELEVGRDVPVGVCMERSAEMIIALLAVLKAGGAYVPLDPTHPAERRALMIEDTAMCVILTDTKNRTAGAAVKHSLCVGTENFAGFDNTNLTGEGRAQDMCYIMYTSGSTGAPKGVAVTHRGVVRLVKETNYASFSEQIFLQLAPISFDASTFEIWGALLNGGELVMMPPAPPTLQEIGSAIREHGVTTLWLTAGLFNAIVDERLGDLRPLQQLLAGGDVLSVSHVRKALRELTGTRLINGYGPTETTTFACCHSIADDADLGDSIPIGQPIANTTAYILDAQLHPVPIGVTGELFLGGDGLARGYWGSPELTAEKFIDDPFSTEPNARLYRTGDLARWREDGVIEFLGRIDTQVKLRGYRIELGEIESALRQQSDVLDSAVVVRENAPGDKQLIAYIVRQPGAPPEWKQSALIAAVKKSLPDYMVPSVIVALPALPRTANGKLDRSALPAENRSAAQSKDNFVAPKTPLEKKVAAIWKKLLGVKRVSVTDNFFDLGGHSLLGLRLVNQLREMLGEDVDVAFTIVFEAPTLVQMAKMLGKNYTGARKGAAAAASEPLVPVVPVNRETRRTRRPDIFFQPRKHLNRNNHSSASSAHHRIDFETDAKGERPAKASKKDESVFVFPATLAQRRFWLLDQLQPGGNPALNMSLAMRWHGPLDQLVLRRALNEVVARHEALRTTFEGQRGQLHQLVAPTLVLDLPILDASAFRETSALDLPAQLMQEEVRQPFDLLLGPLVRARLLRLAPLEHLLLITVHHIVSDGWSNAILTRDLCAFYTALLQDTPSPLPQLTIQFADYADWQEARVTDDDFAAQRAYWRQQLAGDLPGLELPFDRRPRSDPNVSGEIRSRVLPLELVRAAKSLGGEENATPFMIFFAIFQVLVHRYTGQEDFLVTSPSANRQRREFESLIGPFANPLLLRANLHGDPTFQELLDRIRSVALEAFSNQDIPFEMLLDEFQAPRLQVNFHYDSGSQQPVNLPDGLTLELLPSASVGTVYELSASVLEYEGTVRLELEYNPTLFDAETIDRMLGHYQTLLESAVSDPATAVSALPLLTRGEEKNLGLEKGSVNTTVPTHLDIRAPLVERVMAKPDAVAARHGRRELSCAELLARMESARNADKSNRAPADLDQAASWVAHWRARVDTAPPLVTARSPEVEASIASASLALRECARLYERERMASCSLPGAAATEEIGAAILANALLVYPTPDLLLEPAAALAAWLETENIAVACLPAATWNRLAVAIAARKARKPTRLRLVIATEGPPGDGSFGRISADSETGPAAAVRVCRRTVLEAAGGTIALDGRSLQPITGRLRVLDARSGQPLPIGVIGELFITDGKDRTIRTGELARWLSAGLLDRLGPPEEQSYARGFRIDPRRTEALLCQIAGVRHALVRPAIRDPSSRLIAYVLPDYAAAPLPSDGALRQHLHEQGLPDQFVPALFVPLKDVPLSAADGELDRAALPSPSKSGRTAPESVQPYVGLQLQLLAIWEDVLGVRDIGIRDDFFDLGGNSLLAMRMLHRAELACGKVILPAALFRNPTVERLAGEMAREVIDESPTLLRVNDAGTRTPFFYLHGDLFGGGFYSLKLSRALGPKQPFYVLPPRDIRMLPATPSIKEMAAAHLNALRAVRPKGPYIVGGFCIGGLVAYELAQQIKAAGDDVEMLLIIDAAPENRVLRTLRTLSRAWAMLLRWDDHKKVAHFGRSAVWYARLLRWQAQNERTQSGLPFRIYDGFVTACGMVRRRLLSRPRHFAESKETIATKDADRDAASVFLWAATSYRGHIYDGPMAVLLSEDVLRNSSNISRKWQQLAPEVMVHPLKGSHLECITAHVDTLAATIQSCLQTAGETFHCGDERDVTPTVPVSPGSQP
jgi:amino acid adenylation domain-containing protein